MYNYDARINFKHSFARQNLLDTTTNIDSYLLLDSPHTQIWANSFSAERGAGDLVFTEEESWGTGSQVTTTLYNDKNEASGR